MVLEQRNDIGLDGFGLVSMNRRRFFELRTNIRENGGIMVTLTNLRSQNSKALAQMAKTEGVAGWNSMKKEQLIQAILKIAKKRQQSPKASDSKTKSNSKPISNGSNGKASVATSKTATKSKPTNRVANLTQAPAATKKTKVAKSLDVERSAIAAKLQKESAQRERIKDLALAAAISKECRTVEKDRLVLLVRDPFWLQAYWEITPATVKRVRSSLEKHWRGAKPVLRLFEIVEESDAFVENLVREIEVHSGVDTWYIDIQSPSKMYRLAIGYLTANGKFTCIAKSNRVTPPSPNAKGQSDHWTDIASDCENVFAMSGGYDPREETSDLRNVFEEKLKRPMLSMGPNHAALLDHNLNFPFEVDAQMVIYGAALPGASVTLAGEPIPVDSDGNFSIRMELPDKRQVLPVVACSRDGSQQRTTVLAIERNTKVMEAVNIDGDDM